MSVIFDTGLIDANPRATQMGFTKPLEQEIKASISSKRGSHNPSTSMPQYTNRDFKLGEQEMEIENDSAVNLSILNSAPPTKEKILRDIPKSLKTQLRII